MPSTETPLAPPSATAFGTPPVDVSALYQPADAWVVVGLVQEQRLRPRDQKLIQTIAVSFRVPGLAGVFTIRIDNYAFTHADVREYLFERAWLITQLYALPARLPAFDYQAALGSRPLVTLDQALPTVGAQAGAIAWAGTIDARGEATTATLEATALGEPEPALVSDAIDAGSSSGARSYSGTLGPLDAGKYSIVLAASSSGGLAVSAARAVTIA